MNFPPFDVSATAILAVLAAGMALLFDYFPGLASWFDTLEPDKKKLIMLALSAVLGAGAFLGSCLGWFSTNLMCTLTSAWTLALDVFVTVSASYVFHQATKPSESLKKAMWGARK